MKINPIGLTLGLIGQILIACIFILLVPVQIFGAPGIMWLDLIVASIVYWTWFLFTGTAPVNIDDPAHRQVGALGIRWQSGALYTFFALGTAAACILLNIGGLFIPFIWQLIIQLVILFLFVMAMYAASSASKYTARVHQKEQARKAGKLDLRYTLKQVAMAAEDTQDIPGEIAGRIGAVSEDARFISPSTSPEAKAADRKIQQTCDALYASFADYNLNAGRIENLVGQLERDMKRRRTL